MAQGIVNRVVPVERLCFGRRAFDRERHVSDLDPLHFFLSTRLTPHDDHSTNRRDEVPAVELLRSTTHSFLDGVILKTAMILSLLFSTAGFLTIISTKTSLLLVLFYQGLLRSFGHFNHDEMLAVYCLVVLAFTPCGDAFSVDSWLARKKKERPHFAYAYPILLMQLLVAWTYFSSAIIKMRVAGLKYLSADNLPALAIFHSLDNLHDTSFRLAFRLPEFKAYLPFAVGFILVWELLFPLAIFWRRLRWWILGSRNSLPSLDAVRDEHLLSPSPRDVSDLRQLGPV